MLSDKETLPQQGPRVKRPPLAAGTAAVEDRPMRVASLHPDNFAPDWPPECHVAWSVITDRRRYAPRDEKKAFLSLRSLPSLIRHALDDVDAAASGRSLYACASCAVESGVRALQEHPDVAALEAVGREIRATRFRSGEAETVVREWVRSFDFQIAMPGQSCKLNILTTPEIHGIVAGAADDLGVTLTDLVVLALAVTLSTQDEVHPENRERLAHLVEHVLRRVDFRARGARGLLEHLRDAG